MSDFRATVKIEFSIFGVSDKADMSINWSPNWDDMDDRVTEFFQRVYRKGYAKYIREIAESESESDRREKEQQERATLKLLKAKYETP